MKWLDKKTKIWIGAGLLLLLLVTYGYWLWHRPTSYLGDQQFGFTYLEPAQLPKGFAITAKRISVNRDDQFNIVDMGAELNFRHEDWVYSIMEWRARGDDQQVSMTDLRDFDPTSVGVTCTQGTSPKEQTYRLCHWLDYGRISVYEVQFVKSGTFVRTALPGTKDQPINQAAISTYVDSFAPANPNGLPILDGTRA